MRVVVVVVSPLPWGPITGRHRGEPSALPRIDTPPSLKHPCESTFLPLVSERCAGRVVDEWIEMGVWNFVRRHQRDDTCVD